MSPQTMQDKLALMDMELTGDGVPEDKDSVRCESVSAVITGCRVSEVDPNTVTVVLEVFVPTEDASYQCGSKISYDEENPFRDLFESGSGRVEDPSETVVEVERTEDGFALFGEDLTESLSSVCSSSSDYVVSTYEDAVLTKEESRVGYGTVENFYVLESPPEIQQEYVVGLFVRLPNGVKRTLEVIHDDENPSGILESVVDTDRSIREQLRDDIPLWYDVDSDEWYIIATDFGMIKSKLLDYGFIKPCNAVLEGFGRKYGLGKPRPVPRSLNDIPEDRVPSIDSLV